MPSASAAAGAAAPPGASTATPSTTARAGPSSSGLTTTHASHSADTCPRSDSTDAATWSTGAPTPTTTNEMRIASSRRWVQGAGWANVVHASSPQQSSQAVPGAQETAGAGAEDALGVGERVLVAAQLGLEDLDAAQRLAQAGLVPDEVVPGEQKLLPQPQVLLRHGPRALLELGVELEQLLAHLPHLEAELPPRPVVGPHDLGQQRVRPLVQRRPRREERDVVVEVAREALAGELRRPVLGRVHVHVRGLGVVERRRCEQHAVGRGAQVLEDALGVGGRQVLEHVGAHDEVELAVERLGGVADLVESTRVDAEVAEPVGEVAGLEAGVEHRVDPDVGDEPARL